MFLNILKRNAYVFTAIGLCVLFFHPVLTMDKTFFFRDIHRWFYPMKSFLAENLRSGEIPFWCSHYFCGSPFLSDIQSGVFYPLSIVFFLLPFPLSFNVYVVIHFFLAFCFFYLFITSLGLSRKSALITAISYCYGGYLLATINTLNNISTGIWLPAILWSFTRASETGRTSGYFLTIIFLSMAILGGEPQIFILSAGILFLYALTSLPTSPEKNSIRLKYGGYVVLLVISAILITTVQLGPTYIDYQNSARLGGFSYERASRFSLDLQDLKHLFLPLHFPKEFATGARTFGKLFPYKSKIPWLLTIYPGMIIAPFALLGAFTSFSRRSLIWIAVFLVAILLALGKNTPAHFIF